jgi:hypothetical protein
MASYQSERDQKMIQDYTRLKAEIAKAKKDFDEKSVVLKEFHSYIIKRFLSECKGSASGVRMPDGDTHLFLTFTCVPSDPNKAFTFKYAVGNICARGMMEIIFDRKMREDVNRRLDRNAAKWFVFKPAEEMFDQNMGVTITNNFLDVAIKWYETPR